MEEKIDTMKQLVGENLNATIPSVDRSDKQQMLMKMENIPDFFISRFQAKCG